MPEYQRYTVRVETRVLVVVNLLSGGELPVGEYTVRTEVAGANSAEPRSLTDKIQEAMVRNTRQAKVMGAAVDNTERNRLK